MSDDDRARRIDPELAELSGEAAGQERDPDHAGYPTGTAPEASGDDGGTTYYDRPVLKEPVWIWSVPAYFHVGGVVAGASMLGTAAQLVDRDGLDGFTTQCRMVAAVGCVVGTALLVHDLGRPARFLNMLRVFRPSSAMSMGSWTLAAASGATTASALAPRLLGGRAGRVLGDGAGLAAGLIAPVLGTYTAVLVSDTAVPVWRATRTRLPVLFGAGAMSAAASTLDVLDLDERAAGITRRVGIVAKAAELVAAGAVEQAADEDERVGRPLHEGLSGDLWSTSHVLTAASLVASLVPVAARFRRIRRRIAAALGMIASLLSRFAVLHAGRASARDPRATFQQQRAGHGGQQLVS